MQAREYEDIRQFVLRGAPRDPGFCDLYDVYLYSRDQAEMLQRYLIENGIAAEVVLVPVDEAGIMDVVRPAPKRADLASTDPLGHQKREAKRKKADADRQQRYRDQDVARRKADGTHRKAGRPRKTLGGSPAVLRRSADRPA